LDAVYDRYILMHGRENVLAAISIPSTVVFERMSLGKEQ
jgi:hypothetical protein